MTKKVLVAICLEDNTAIFDTGDRVPITNYYCDGEPCEAEVAVSFVAGSEELGWYCDLVSNFTGKPH